MRSGLVLLLYLRSLLFRLTIVDTPGFGDGLEGADAWQVLTYNFHSFPTIELWGSFLHVSIFFIVLEPLVYPTFYHQNIYRLFFTMTLRNILVTRLPKEKCFIYISHL